MGCCVFWVGKLQADTPVYSQSSPDSLNSSVVSTFLYQNSELQLFGLDVTTSQIIAL